MRTNRRILALRLAVLVVVMALAACAAPGKFGPLACSGPGICDITVTVDDQCNVDVDDKVEVHGQSRVLRWKLAAPPGYRFAANGISFKEPGDMFHNPTPADTTYIWHDRNPPSESQANGQGTEHEYEIHVLHDGVACPLPDPWIVNRG